MPRAGQTTPESPTRLSDLVSIGVLTRVFPPELVDEVIAATGKTEQRHRALPARVTAYFTIAMALNPQGSYADVLDQLTDGLSWASGWKDTYQPPSPAAVVQARQRLGSAPLRLLFDRVAGPVAEPDTPGAFVASRRVMSIDGTCLDVPDTGDNDEHFSRPGTSRGGASAFPQARLVAMAECATHSLCGVQIGPYTTAEATLVRPLVDNLGEGMLVTADRGFFSYRLWREATATGADLLFRLRTDASAPVPEHLRDLPDGSWIATMKGKSNTERNADDPFTVRVIDYHLDTDVTDPADPADPVASADSVDGDEHSGQVYRLITTILDPDIASAEQLAETYTMRWEIESAFDELKTHQRGPKAVLRSKSPTLVYQEIYGMLCLHLAIRRLMGRAATESGTDPRRLSFTAALRITRNTRITSEHPGSFSP
ncbi:IS4 family transposase [Corynebacterium sp.]|uniref:IS4 family transposase n=1 Tax=Corynebacterium sp. TaxID=1720 RepID=UPI0028A8F36F|nr:IS4 family transposase [Corynebacterium sp.]